MNIGALISLLKVFCGADEGFSWYLVVAWNCLIWRLLLIQLRDNVFVCVLDRPIIGIVYQPFESLDRCNFRASIALLKIFSILASILSLPRHPFSAVCISLCLVMEWHGIDLIETFDHILHF